MNRFRYLTAVCVLAVFFQFTAAVEPSVSAETPPPVYVVLFTHIEDNCPPEPFDSEAAAQIYLEWRRKTIDIALLFQKNGLQWVFEPDWTFLEAALIHETASLTATTGGKNLLRYLKEDLGVAIDPHSHEHRGYNYTDVAHLLDSLGAGGSTVIGGHVWDPSIPQFQDWDRFRAPVRGTAYPWATWRGDILMGSATPGHTNDPEITGVWRPRDRDHFFEDDPAGNIAAVGQYKQSEDDTYAGFLRNTLELAGLYESGAVSEDCMLTISTHLSPSEINAPHGLQIIEDSLLVPMALLQNQGKVKVTDFTALVEDWKNEFGSISFIYDPSGSTSVERTGRPLPEGFSLSQNHPNPFNPSTFIGFHLPVSGQVSLRVYDMMGREVAVLADRFLNAGAHRFQWDASGFESGVYFCRIRAGEHTAVRKMVLMK